MGDMQFGERGAIAPEQVRALIEAYLCQELVARFRRVFERLFPPR